MASNSPTHFTLRPWPEGSRKPKSLGEFIARVNAERGGFRNVTEDSLRKELEAQQNGVVDSSEAAMSIDSESDDGEAVQVKIEDIHAARAEVAKNAEFAHQNALMALDFVSLLLSKETPVQVTTTLSPALRELVGIGTLGADKLAASRLSDAQLQDNKLVATGWKLADINKTVDSVLSSASRLQEEIDLETKYWAEVLAVSDSGWSVTRVPQEKHTLGVRYGFLESAADFKNRSLAPMRRDDNGDVTLDCGQSVGESQRLCVTIERNGQIVGRSSIQKPLMDGAPLEERVREARNTVFAQELWHELNREARSLLSYEVRLEEAAVTYQMDEESRMIFSLRNLGEEDPDEGTRAHAEDSRAETMSILLHLLLSYAHRQNNHRRSKPAINGRSPPSPPPYSLLRPIIAYMAHEQAVAQLVRFVSELTTVLRAAGIDTAQYVLRESSISPNASAASRSSASEALIYSLLSPLEFQIELTTTPEARLLLHGRTLLFPVSLTAYHIYLLPPSGAPKQEPSDASESPADQPQQSPPTNPLQDFFPPGDSPHGYPNLHEVFYYIREAVPRALVSHFIARADPWHADAGLPPAESEWGRTIGGAALWDSVGESGVARFEVAHAGDRDRPAESEMEEEEGEPALGQGEGETDAGARHRGGGGGRPVELRLYGRWFAEHKINAHKWTWTVEDALAGTKRESLEEMVKAVVQRHPKLW